LDELLPSVAVLGIVVTVLVVLASGGCGSWLTPNLAGCESVGPIGLVPPLAGLATFVLCLWAVPHLSAGRA
jgi:hypothetical protein